MEEVIPVIQNEASGSGNLTPFHVPAGYLTDRTSGAHIGIDKAYYTIGMEKYKFSLPYSSAFSNTLKKKEKKPEK